MKVVVIVPNLALNQILINQIRSQIQIMVVDIPQVNLVTKFR